jgi:dihydrolipoamide dehydrogenase
VPGGAGWKRPGCLDIGDVPARFGVTFVATDSDAIDAARADRRAVGMSARQCDLAVIGSGPGGYAAALEGARRGLKVAVFERGPVGGVCLNVGCIPTKAWVTVAHTLRRIRRAAALGIRVAEPALDFAAVQARTERIVAQCRQGMTMLLRQHGAELVAGTAAFEGPRALRVQTSEGAVSWQADRVVVATGGAPSAGPWTFDGRRIVSYRELLASTALPRSLVIVGGGVIGCEFASCLSAYGVAVTVIEREPQLLPSEDPEAVRVLTNSLRGQGVTVLTHAAVQTLTASDQGVRVVVRSSDPAQATASTPTQTIDADQALIAVGVRPNGGGLGLEALGVSTERGIAVDRFLRTSQPHIAAIGDCLAGHGLAHVASAEGQLAVRNLCGEPPSSLEDYLVPRCVFTDPEVAQVGVVESQAPADARVSRFAFGALGKSLCDDEPDGFAKLIVDPASDRVVGATIIGAHASSLIHTAVVAIQHGLTARQLTRTITAHPTLPEAVSEAAAQIHGEALYAKSTVRAPRRAAPAPAALG